MCKVIGTRSRQHRKKAVRERQGLIREEVLSTVRILESQNQYPSVVRVLSNMKTKSMTKSNTATVHKILKEILLDHEQ